MKNEDVRKLVLGLYRIHWKGGGTSIASVGQTYAGLRWMAPCNWTCGEKVPGTFNQAYWDKVKKVELITTA